MALSVSYAYIPPATVSLPSSDQKLVSQTLMDSAKQAAATIYHPSEATQTAQESLQAVYTWIGRSQSPVFLRFVGIFTGAQSVLKTWFKTFEAVLATAAPDSAKIGGFTVESHGRLKVFDKAGQA
ncbi:hypothetical protein [Pseudomonas sp. HN8-3]|uniref:hypothetical protein n=1 Tax=Pseudomonas sp. HN8-3 TaxID=2886361 RepID=UPI001E320387|nr:hypothetical protein [Pseudomonas sp. HN8-3]UEH06790.1 hypothetical protein LJX92_17790 [Pseudomonas sp. HN8-3]